MQPIKLQRERILNRVWTPKGKVWFQKNDDTEWEVQAYPSREMAQKEKDKDESFGFKTKGRVHKVEGSEKDPRPIYFYDANYDD